MNEPSPTYGWAMSQIWMSMSHIRMNPRSECAMWHISTKYAVHKALPLLPKKPKPWRLEPGNRLRHVLDWVQTQSCFCKRVQGDLFFPVRVAVGVLQGVLQWFCTDIFSPVCVAVCCCCASAILLRRVLQRVLQWVCCSGYCTAVRLFLLQFYLVVCVAVVL